MKKAKFGVGIILGAIVGAIAGLLTAPKSGKQTRTDLKRRSERLKSDTFKKADDVKERAEDLAKDAKEKAEDYKIRAEKAVNAAKGEFKKSPETDTKPAKKA